MVCVHVFSCNCNDQGIQETQMSVNHANRSKKMLWYALKRKRKQQVHVVKRKEHEEEHMNMLRLRPALKGDKMNKLFLVLHYYLH